MSKLREWFGPSKAEVWAQLATEIGAEFVAGDFWNGEKVQASIGPWTVTLDSYVVSTGKVTLIYTRFRAPYINQDGLRFTLMQSGILSGFAKWFDAQDIEVGVPEFDKIFTIQGTNPQKVQLLFSDPQLQTLLLSTPDATISVEDDEGWFGAKFPEGVDELRLQIFGEVTDLARLKAYYELFAALLDRLCAIGSAYRDDPHVKLS
jgi:hypothetical protein